MKDTAPGPDGIPYSVYNKLWEQAGPLIKKNYAILGTTCVECENVMISTTKKNTSKMDSTS